MSDGPWELEVAATRGRDFVARCVFRAPAQVSIGRSVPATVVLPDEGVPEYRPVLRLATHGALLEWEEGASVELRDGAAATSGATLVETGRAQLIDGRWQVAVGPRGKGLARFGEISLLFKVRPRSDAPVVAMGGFTEPACGRCGVPLGAALLRDGALTACSGCSALNDGKGWAPRGTPMRGDVDTQGALTIPAPVLPAQAKKERLGPAKAAELPTFDAIAVGKGADLPTFDGIDLRKGANLPSFDAIPRPDKLLAEPKADLSALFQQLSPGRGADLPTYDAISAIRDQGLSTQSAIKAMRGDDDGEPPVKLTDIAPLARSAPVDEPDADETLDRPADDDGPPTDPSLEAFPLPAAAETRVAPSVMAAAAETRIAPSPAAVAPVAPVQALVTTAPQPFAEPDLSRDPDADFFADDFAAGAAFPASVGKIDVPEDAAPTPPLAEAQTAREPGSARDAEPVRAKGDDLEARRAGESSAVRRAARSGERARPRPRPADDDEGEGDDFLMGRSGGDPSARLVLIGALCGGAGLVLLLWRFFFA